MAEAAVLEIAADWADRIDALDAGERRLLIAWLNESEAHLRAFTRMHELLRDPALLEVLEAARPAAAALPDAVPRRRSTDRQPRAAARRVPARRIAAAAAGLAAVAAVPLLWRAAAPPAPKTAAVAGFRHASPVGQREQLRLRDGSTIALDAASTVRIAFADHARPVMLERGAARFDVAHDASRPFSVQSGAARFTALGTNFSVDQLPGAVELHVYRGRVRVDQPGRSPIVVTGGEWVSVGAAPLRVQRFDPRAPSGLDSIWLSADGMRLDAALARIGRHSAVPIRLADPALGATRLSGRFRLDTPAQSTALIGALVGLAPRRRGDAIVLEPPKAR
ncbi:FecR family protein [Sphingomonas sp. R1]|uniref:FecR family protein n=1 Tax=Sphingomonas sp. R1 TaxID=399176 RepID=UPI0022252EF9|nr:FecR domain-containing protein [Sphingomonas sp. R1]UYY78900.1 FecR domain-containing protein [Sphingomonas sp. R1]